MNRIVSSIIVLGLWAGSVMSSVDASAAAAKPSPDWDFNNPALGVEWSVKGATPAEGYTLTERNGFLRLKPLSGIKTSLVGRQQEHADFQATTRLEVADGASAGITAYLAEDNRCDLYVKDGKVYFRSIINGKVRKNVVGDVLSGFVEMKIKGTPETYTFYYAAEGQKFVEAGHIDASSLTGKRGVFGDVSIGLFAEDKGHADFDCFKYREVIPEISPKLALGNGNPLLDFIFTADPTAVEHDGRLYVYATNDHQQYEAVGRDGKNSYEKIKSLVMMSTDDMVNWTYHGLIDVGEIAPWVIASWAPSIVKREESDGKTHFYLYFSNSGFGTGVITADSPVGPWTSPLDKSLIDANTPELGDCKVPFDPGAVIDDNGIGWLSVGGSMGRIMRLGDDMTSFVGEIKELPAPHHFEANELNFINGTYVYTYNTDWKDHSDWPYPGEIPSICSMCYMTSKTPLDPGSWTYGRPYLKNSGDYGYTFTNNHTHLHKFMDKWYVIYHSMELQNSFNTDGGFRNVCIDEIKVDEDNVTIYMADQTLEGPAQIKPLDPFALQQAETTAATQGMSFVAAPDGKPGNMVAVPVGNEGLISVRGVVFGKKPAEFTVVASGCGTVEVRKGSATGDLLAGVNVAGDGMNTYKAAVSDTPGNTPCDLYLIIKGKGLTVDGWQFK